VKGTVGITDNKAPQVGAVTVAKTTNKAYYIVSWDAAAENLSYRLYFKKDGAMSSEYLTSGQNTYKYDAVSGVQLPNDNFDKWSFQVSSYYLSSVQTPGNYLFGVQTSSQVGGVTSVVSDIKWSAPFALTAFTSVSGAVTATKASATSISASWPAVTSPSASYYGIYLEKDGGIISAPMAYTNSYAASTLAAGNYRIGVVAAPPLSGSDFDISKVISAIVWSNQITLP
jgi:fibronectin type 3 domain-containing protein